jgi:nicotinate dehydrogenase subunit A
MAIEFTLNGNKVSVDVDAQTPLLDVLRNDLGLNGPKFGCGLAQCGSCAVIVDGSSTRSCVMPVATIAGKSIVTLEGLGNASNPHPLQTAFIEEQALQCGYCTSGIIASAAAFLERNPSPTDDEIKKALSSHLCRCGAQPRVVRAVAKAARRMVGGSS